MWLVGVFFADDSKDMLWSIIIIFYDVSVLVWYEINLNSIFSWNL